MLELWKIKINRITIKILKEKKTRDWSVTIQVGVHVLHVASLWLKMDGLLSTTEATTELSQNSTKHCQLWPQN